MTAATETRGRTKDRDFAKVNDQHARLAEYVNKNSGLSPVKPNHVKAVLALKTDFAGSPEEVTRRAQAKADRERAKIEREKKAKRFDGLTSDQIKAIRKTERLAKAAAKAREDMEKLFSDK